MQIRWARLLSGTGRQNLLDYLEKYSRTFNSLNKCMAFSRKFRLPPYSRGNITLLFKFGDYRHFVFVGLKQEVSACQFVISLQHRSDPHGFEANAAEALALIIIQKAVFFQGR